ncbi:unnamed protein product [Sordaria macrospora k-hell]|uniref:WGS project CABT00000000 data, contig 2.3 n=1 Tax=Sordaria macrospora (strain ATCC MYA-333 / DSM 997 / K(L3346) / K-hell) TaxID=771870 RepID=F7VPX7_SORMK|nr:uncharacterized protein SMAC_06757 [Sordaria macrospora k-hell]CCC07555.1 unnamed protein product [Sordaria macrospora k-hell]
MDLDPQEDNPVEMNVDRDGNSHDSDNESFKSAIDEPFDLRELYQDALEEPSEELSDQVSSPAALTARAYQLEMFEASLRQNIIVAMDTGSGKTQVAVLRIARELEQSDKRIWFLVPTVALAHQQHQVLQSQIPSVKTLLICGHDGVDSWSDQAVWDAILLNVRIVVSTYQILSDANAHGFVRLDSLSLIVIDEAHNCSKSHPISRMMTEAYLPAKRAGLPVPSILGLTASPLMSNNLDDIEKLEQVLDAVCRTPTKHREELLEHVNRPEMLVFPYGDSGGPVTEPAPTDLMIRFREAYHGLDIRKDPEVLLLKAQRTERARQKLRHAVTKKDTTAQKEMKGVYNRSILVHKEVGPWAADYYLTRAISQMLAELEHEHSDHFRYIGEALRSIPIPTVSKEPIQLSSKVQTLLRILSSHQEDPVGIVFVQERVMVSIVTHIISTHPLTKDRYRTAAMIGTANVPGRKQHFKDMTNAGDNKSLEGFREGRFNLLVATNVLEEGIDVPICNLVICFDKPSNIKSFIQRRGRARKGSSTLYLMVQDASGESATGWRDLERLMKEKYEDEMRETAELELVEDPRLGSYPVLEVERMETPLEFAFILPVPVPYMAPLKLWWNATSALELITDSEMQEFCKEGVARAGPDHSYALLAMAFQHRFPLEGKQYPIRLVSTQRKLDVAGIAALEFDPQLYESFTDPPLVRLVEGTPFFVTKVLPSKPPAELVLKPSKEHADLPEDVPYVVYKSLSKAVGQFLPPEAAHEHDNWIPKDGKLYQKVLPSTSIRMDDFPAAFAQVGAVMPAFTRAVEMSLVAADLMYNRLGCLELDNLLLVTTALTSIGSRAPTNYERLEFLGDTILKFCACLTASALFPNHHERLLSQWKDSLVNNVRLCRASIDFGLDEYIIHSMASKKWRPKFVENYLDDSKSPKSAETREMSSKMVADVIESLIGATYMCGDMSKALECIALLLPTSKSSKFKWQDIGLSRDKLFELAPNDAVLHKQLEPLEKAMGYAFTKKSLLIEAMTHPSCPGLGDNDSCYERLEFLGDAILDVIVVKRLMAETGPNELAHNDMHEYLSSVVTADIMAFLAMEWVIARTDTVEIDPARLDAIDSLPFSKHTKITPANLVSNTEDWAFWRFMRHNSSHVASAQTVTQERYLTLRDDIRTAIWEKHELPWALLARMGPQKFYSDIVESLVGAVWVDSGSWEVCEHVLNQMGLLPLLDHLIRTKAHVMHPNVELHILAPPSKRETRTEFVIISNKRGIISHGTEFADETNAVDDGLVKVEPYHDDDVPTQGEVFSCKLFVGGKQVADVTGAGTKEEARVRAAEKGCLVIKAERRKAMAENKAVDGAAVADNEGSSQDADGDTVMD